MSGYSPGVTRGMRSWPYVFNSYKVYSYKEKRALRGAVPERVGNLYCVKIG